MPATCTENRVHDHVLGVRNDKGERTVVVHLDEATAAVGSARLPGAHPVARTVGGGPHLPKRIRASCRVTGRVVPLLLVAVRNSDWELAVENPLHRASGVLHCSVLPVRQRPGRPAGLMWKPVMVASARLPSIAPPQTGPRTVLTLDLAQSDVLGNADCQGWVMTTAVM
mmetsp:Transcript_41280/g.90055  ORF Transcript_41280/g.90055 Transcript_41280/m.90055 type:complete len:169 (+) Transcript_41280:779-1285(+)